MKLYIIASTWEGVELSLKVISKEQEALSYVKDLIVEIGDEYLIEPADGQSFEDYFTQYYKWVKDDNDNICKVDITYEIIDTD